tara:strand:- start:145 stop:333 length:189 start_codon:yes stop_codon:yes gene_type:complete
MANSNKYKSLSVKFVDWQELGEIAIKTNRSRSTTIARLIRFYKERRNDQPNNSEECNLETLN